MTKNQENIIKFLETDNNSLRKANHELLKALNRVIDYAEGEAHSLESLGRDDERTAEEAKRAWLALSYATRMINKYKEQL